uniref:Uncharacterized protein n=1 Tax=Rhizophora mucronata TaxID=61149 RepID=A0A2P2Q7P8_RHIMU
MTVKSGHVFLKVLYLRSFCPLYRLTKSEGCLLCFKKLLLPISCGGQAQVLSKCQESSSSLSLCFSVIIHLDF